MAIDEYIGKVWNLDALDLLHKLPGASVDLALTDIPYGVHEKKWDKLPDLDALFSELWRVVTYTGVIVMTAQQPLTSIIVMKNYDYFRDEVIWEKSLCGNYFNAKHSHLRIHENILVFSKAPAANVKGETITYNPQGLKARKNGIKNNHPKTLDTTADNHITTRASWKKAYKSEDEGYPVSVIRIPNPNNYTEYTNQKPVELFEYLIKTYSNPGAIVCDPYVGSGTTALAARNTGRRWIVNDLSPDACQLTERRVNDMFAALEANG